MSTGMAEQLGDPARKRRLTRQVFDTVAGTYDAVNPILSLGRDRAWKRALVEGLPAIDAPVCVDLACGTGDLCELLARRYAAGRVIGIDHAESMLGRARARLPDPRIELRCADMAETGLADASADLVTGGYALRNAAELEPALDEIARVLKPGGCAAFLDFSKPVSRLAQRAHRRLLTAWCGTVGWLLRRRPELYTYIADSMMAMPDRRRLLEMFRDRGLDPLRLRHHFGGLLQSAWLVRR